MESPTPSDESEFDIGVDKLLDIAASNSLEQKEQETARQLATPVRTPATRRAMRSVRFDGLNEGNIVEGERRTRRASSRVLEATEQAPTPSKLSKSKPLKAKSKSKPKSKRTTGEEEAARKVMSAREAKEAAASHARVVAAKAAAAKAKEREKAALAQAREAKKLAKAAQAKSKKRAAEPTEEDNASQSQSQSQRRKPSPVAFKVKWLVEFDGQELDSGFRISSTEDARHQLKDLKRACSVKAAIHASAQETSYYLVDRTAVVTCHFNRATTSDDINLKTLGQDMGDINNPQDDCVDKLIDLIRFNESSRKTGHEVLYKEQWFRVQGGLPSLSRTDTSLGTQGDPSPASDLSQNAPNLGLNSASIRDKRRSEKSIRTTQKYESAEGLFWKEVRTRYLCTDFYCKNRANGHLACLPLKSTGHVPITGHLSQVWQREMKKGRATVKTPSVRVVDVAFAEHQASEAKQMKASKTLPLIPQQTSLGSDNRSMNLFFGPGMNGWPQQSMLTPAPPQEPRRSSPLSAASNDDTELEGFFDLLVAKRPRHKEALESARESFVNDAWTIQSIRKVTDDPNKRHKDDRFCFFVPQGGIRDTISDLIRPYIRQLKQQRRQHIAEIEAMASDRKKDQPIVIGDTVSEDEDISSESDHDEVESGSDEDDRLLDMADS